MENNTVNQQIRLLLSGADSIPSGWIVVNDTGGSGLTFPIKLHEGTNNSNHDNINNININNNIII